MKPNMVLFTENNTTLGCVDKCCIYQELLILKIMIDRVPLSLSESTNAKLECSLRETDILASFKCNFPGAKTLNFFQTILKLFYWSTY